MSINEPVEIVSEQVIEEEPREETIVIEQTPINARLPSNQEVMVAQILKRVKSQSKSLDVLARKIDAVSKSIAETNRTQAKELRIITTDLKRLQVIAKKSKPISSKSANKRKTTASTRKRKSRRA